jgi:hypothetical protein
VTNQDFNTSTATVQITVSGGVPYYMAVLVDSTAYSTANWTAYNSSNLVVNLGSVEGWHTVSVGLKGYQPDAQQTWNQIQLKLVLTPPVLIVTNPIPGTVTQPVVQLQGYCSENLASISYDLSNSATFETNQQAFVTSSQFDTNNFEYTTTGFECFNIPLADGTNTVTLHATDSAGNVTVTNLVYILDPTANTNPPVINLSWPQNNASISGTNFPVRGVVNDPFATVSAQIVNGGGASSLAGLVEQNGSFWIENAPLGSGTNYLTITATNTAGYGSATNIVVFQSSVTLTITSVTFNEPMSPTATVTGTLTGGSSIIVLVNGIEATNNGDGTWTAYYVPVGDSGTASISADATANGVPSAMDAQTAKDVVKGPEVVFADYRLNDHTTEGNPVFEKGVTIMNWAYGSGGNWFGSVCDPESSFYTYSDAIYDATGSGTHFWFYCTTNCGEVSTPYYYPTSQESVSLPDYGANANVQVNYPGFSDQYQVKSRYTLKTGGQALPGQQNLWCIHATAVNYPINPATNWGLTTIPIPPSQITIAGQTLDANGNVYVALPNNSPPIDITPMASPNDYTFTPPTATEYQAQIQANGTTLDPSKINATFCVGQQINFTLDLAIVFGNNGTQVSFTNVLCNWTLPAKFVNVATPNSAAVPCTNYTTNYSLLDTTNNSCTCWYVNGSGGNVSVGASLIMPNGKSVSLAALGQFAIYSPSIDDLETNAQRPFVFLDATNAPTIYLGLGTESGMGTMSFYLDVNVNTNYMGKFFYVNLIKRNQSHDLTWFETVSVTTGRNYWLDNVYPYKQRTWDMANFKSIPDLFFLNFSGNYSAFWGARASRPHPSASRRRNFPLHLNSYL